MMDRKRQQVFARKDTKYLAQSRQMELAYEARERQRQYLDEQRQALARSTQAVRQLPSVPEARRTEAMNFVPEAPEPQEVETSNATHKRSGFTNVTWLLIFGAGLGATVALVALVPMPSFVRPGVLLLPMVALFVLVASVVTRGVPRFAVSGWTKAREFGAIAMRAIRGRRACRSAPARAVVIEQAVEAPQVTETRASSTPETWSQYIARADTAAPEARAAAASYPPPARPWPKPPIDGR